MHASLPAVLAADEYTPMSLRQVVLVFVALPAAIYFVIWLLWSFPRWRRSDSYRPGDPWTADAAWFGAPDAVEGAAPAALEAAPGEARRTDDAADAIEPAPAAPQGGGTSARW
jgi:hypothetical protein